MKQVQFLFGFFSGTGKKSCFISNACDLGYMGKETNKFSDLKYPRFDEFSNHVYTLPYKLLEQQQLYIFFLNSCSKRVVLALGR